MLLQALLGCAGVTLRSVATAMRLELRDVRLRVDGYFDARGTLGLDKSVPVGVQDVVVTAEVSTDADDTALARLAELTERYCVVAQSLADRPRLVVRRAYVAHIARLSSDQSHLAWDNSLPPAVRLAPGDTIELDVQDASGGQIGRQDGADAVGRLDFAAVNPCTGPVFVEGAEPGDELVVTILDIATDPWGWTANIPASACSPRTSRIHTCRSPRWPTAGCGCRTGSRSTPGR